MSWAVKGAAVTGFAAVPDRRAVVLQTARRQIPVVLALAGLLTLAFGVVNLVALPDEAAGTWVINAVFGPLFLLLAWILRRGYLLDTLLPWVWAACSIALVAMLLQAYAVLPTAANLAYIVLTLIVFAPLTHAWSAFLISAVVLEPASAIVFFSVLPPIEARENALVCASALLVGALLLRLRLTALGDLADLQMELARQATYDPLTETLNRHGFDSAVPAFLATAERSGDSVLVWFVDVRGLKRANDQLGHRFGDDLLKSVTRALQSSIRANDLLVRWGGDEFLVLGTGSPGSAEDLNARVDRVLADDAAIAPQWPGAVTVGFASATGIKDTAALENLIAHADEDMYRRRAAAGTAPTNQQATR